MTTRSAKSIAPGRTPPLESERNKPVVCEVHPDAKIKEAGDKLVVEGLDRIKDGDGVTEQAWKGARPPASQAARCARASARETPNSSAA